MVSLQDLAEARGGKIPQEVLVGILKQILEGLAYAHAHGAIHRDLKPSNILLMGGRANRPGEPKENGAPGGRALPKTEDGPIQIKIADFGLVRLVGEEWVRSQAQLSVQRSMSMGDLNTLQKEGEGTSTKSLLGTYEYMSPEQKRGEEATERSDLYAVGLMAYRLLTGRGLSMKTPSQIDKALAREWDAFLAEALEEEAGERWADAKAMRSGLDPVGVALGKRIEDARKADAELRARAEAEKQARAKEEAKRLADQIRRREEEERRAAAEAEARRQAERKRLIVGKASEPPKELPQAGSAGLKRRAGSIVRKLLILVAAIGVGMWLWHEASFIGGKKIELVKIESGSFQMGSPSGGHDRERPVRTVEITQGFWVGKFEVTQRQYKDVMGANPSRFWFRGGSRPVERVSWHYAVEFCRKLTERERNARRLPEGYVYRLPTEAEWEYAARGGNRSRGFTYSGGNDIGTVAWHSGNSGGKTQEVGKKGANELGLHDMSGNVWEWCWDWYQNSYSGLGTRDPTGPASGSYRVCRGGGWRNGAASCRVADRFNLDPQSPFDPLGFRVVLAAPVQ